jgi:hypothetical protein
LCKFCVLREKVLQQKSLLTGYSELIKGMFYYDSISIEDINAWLFLRISKWRIKWYVERRVNIITACKKYIHNFVLINKRIHFLTIYFNRNPSAGWGHFLVLYKMLSDWRRLLVHPRSRWGSFLQKYRSSKNCPF